MKNDSDKKKAPPLLPRRHFRIGEHLRGYALSVLFHLALLLLLATLTLTTGAGGYGLGMKPKGATVRLTVANDTVSDQELEELLETVDVKPLRVEKSQTKRAELPQLKSIASVRPNSSKLDNIATRYTSSSGSVGSLGGEFGSFIGLLRKKGLDVAIVIDATASMQYVIDDMKETSVAIVKQIQSLVPIARIGAVVFRDRGEAFVARWSDLSFHGNKIQAFISGVTAEGGGDWEEGVRQGLESAIEDLSWRKRAKRVIILVGSSPPHKEDMAAILGDAEAFKRAGGVISTIDVTPQMHERFETESHMFRFGRPPDEISPLPEFYSEVRDSYRQIATSGGGDLAAMTSGEKLSEQILFFAFGSKWKKEVARYAKQ